MKKNPEVQLTSLVVAIASFHINLNKAKLDHHHTQLKHRFTSATEVCYNCTAVSAPIKQLALVVIPVL